MIEKEMRTDSNCQPLSFNPALYRYDFELRISIYISIAI